MAAAINVKFTNSAEAISPNTSVRVHVPERAGKLRRSILFQNWKSSKWSRMSPRESSSMNCQTTLSPRREFAFPVARARRELTISISTSSDVSQPNPLSNGQTVVTPKTDAKVKEDRRFQCVCGLPHNEEDRVRIEFAHYTSRRHVSMFQVMKEGGRFARPNLLIR